MGSMISKNFSANEFDCHDGTPVPPELLSNLTRLIFALLQPIRDAWGAPLIVVSGYRTPEYNAKVGGAGASTHLKAEGADIRPIYLRDVTRLYDRIHTLHLENTLTALGGLGRYPNWVHVDTRKVGGRLRQWKGTGIASEPAA